jgi:hypothetical protein
MNRVEVIDSNTLIIVTVKGTIDREVKADLIESIEEEIGRKNPILIEDDSIRYRFVNRSETVQIDSD